jgi:5-methylcytosine-specific restriction endonuclease McrA
VNQEDIIHEKAIRVGKEFHSKQKELLEIILEVDSAQVFKKKGYPSLFSYCLEVICLSEDIAAVLISIARKSREVPKMKELITTGKIHLTNARKIAKIITPENQDLWLGKAQELSSRELEKELRPFMPKKTSLEFSPEIIDSLRRNQDIECQKQKRYVTLEEVVFKLSQEHLEKHDPLKKAERNRDKQVPVARRVSRSIPAAILHQVNLRDQRQCCFVYPSGKKCASTRWVEIHHIKPYSHGGEHDLGNLITLCSAHHKYLHQEAA